jgi:curli biogenesis system outer membrane secretion channel CsgG
MPFKGEYPFGDAVTDALITELVGSGYSVIERAQLRRIYDEQHLQWTGAVDPSTMLKTGKLAGVNLIVFGSVTTRPYVPASEWLFGEGLEREKVDTVHVRWVDVENGQIVASVTLRNGWGGEVNAVARKIIHSIAS